MNQGEHFVLQASKTAGAVTQKGALVLRPTYAVFLPTEGAVNVIGAVAAGMVGAAAGFVVRITPAQYGGVVPYLGALATMPAQDFDGNLGEASRQYGWWVATPSETVVLFKKVPIFSRFKFWMKKGKDSVGAVFGIPAESVPLVRHLLAGWRLEP